jgi:hypothetical protein
MLMRRAVNPAYCRMRRRYAVDALLLPEIIEEIGGCRKNLVPFGVPYEFVTPTGSQAGNTRREIRRAVCGRIPNSDRMLWPD